MLTAERLRELANYDPATGVFTSRVQRSHVKIGDVLGSRHVEGYLKLTIDYKAHLAHRLAVLWMTGEWPRDQVDHRNLNRADNRWRNLRCATPAQNRWNVPAPRHNTTGFKGVSYHRGRFKAQIRIGGKQTWLGAFDTPEQAHTAYLAAAQEHFGEFAREA